MKSTSTHNTVSENTLMNVEAALKDGKPKTGPEIAKVIKRDYTTVYRALAVLAETDKVDSVKHGRFKLYFKKKPGKEKKPVHAKVHVAYKVKETKAPVQIPLSAEAVKAPVEDIQKSVRQHLAKAGGTTLVDLVRALPYPRSSSYAAIAEMRRLGNVRVNDEGLLELAQPVLVVPGPEPIEGTPTGDLPPMPTSMKLEAPAILASLVKMLTERALTDALRPLVEAHPEEFQNLTFLVRKDG